jgi:uncharacterized protein YceH (UPF0502 family)
MALPLLSLADTRVLGVLVEKQHTVPDTYPLSLNALVAGCNQKTSREPVLELTEAQVQASLDGLRHASLVVESSGGRVMRHAHNLERALGVPVPAVALLAALMLRGPQTVAELRANTERMHRFADASAVEGYLQELATRAPVPLVAELPRAPGAREARWTHLLSGVPEAANGRGDASARTGAGIVARQAASADDTAAEATGAGDLAARVEALERDLAALQADVAALRAQLPGAQEPP